MRIARDALEALRLPRRGAPAPAPRSISARQIAKAVAKVLPRRGLGATGRSAIDEERRAELLGLARSLADGDMAALDDPEAHGECLQLLTEGYQSALYRPMAMLWARQPPAFIQRATFAATRAALAADYESYAFPYPLAWHALRASLSRAEEGEWEACRAEAEALFAESPPELRALIGLAYPEQPDWSDRAARELLESPPPGKWSFWATLSSIADPSLVGPLIRRDLEIAFGHVGAYAADAITLAPDDAVDALLEVFAMTARGRSRWVWGKKSLLALAAALACVDDARVDDALESATKHPDFVPAARAQRDRFGGA